MSLATAGIHCTISQRLSGAMEEFHSPGPAIWYILQQKCLNKWIGNAPFYNFQPSTSTLSHIPSQKPN